MKKSNSLISIIYNKVLLGLLLLFFSLGTYAQPGNPEPCYDTIVIQFGNLPPGPPWLEQGIFITDEPYLNPSFWDVIHIPGVGVFINNATLRFDLTALQRIVIKAELDIEDYCDPGCTPASLFYAGLPVDQTANLTVVTPETLVLHNHNCDSVDMLTISALESYLFEVRLILFCVSCPPDTIICEDDDPLDLTTLDATPAGGTFTDANGDPVVMFDPGVYGVGDHIITYCYEDPDYGCQDCCTFIITVEELPEVVCPESMTMCENDGTVTFTGSPAGGTFSGPGISGSTFDPSAAGAGSHAIEYCYTDPDTNCEACCEFEITVLEAPTVSCPANDEMCIDDPNVTLVGSPPGGTFNGNGVFGNTFDPSLAGPGVHQLEYCYTDPATGCEECCYFIFTVYDLPVVTCTDLDVCIDDGLIALNAGNPPGGDYSGPGVVANSFDPAIAGVGPHTIYYDYTDPFTLCENWCDFIITVHDLPVVSCPPDDEVCVDELPFALTGGLPGGGTYSGQGVAGGVFNPAGAGVGNHGITYTYTDPVTGCSNNCTFNILVHPLPVVNCPPDYDFCVDDNPFMLTGATPPGGVYADIDGHNINPFNPAAWGVGAHTIYYDYYDPTTGCFNYCTFTVYVHPLPIVTCPSGYHVCINDSPFMLTGATPPGGVYADLNGNNINPFNPAAWGVGVHTIYYDYDDPVTGCFNYCSFTVTVNPLPVVTCPANMSVCINDPAFALAGGMPAGGAYAGPGVAGGVFNPAAAGVGVHHITYNYTNPSTGCSNSCVFTITVNALPIVNCPANMSVCIDAPAFALAGGTPAGGVYAGPGVAGGVFNPAAAGAGIHNISYSYTDPITNCSNSCTFNITVHPLPTVNCPQNFTVDLNDPPFALSGATPAGGTYSGAGVTGGTFNPAAAGAGDHIILYEYTDMNGCTDSCTFVITVEFIVVGLYDYGDAPEGALAYLSPPVVGQFPTCENVGPAGSFIRHANNPVLYFGPSVDYETDGNAGLCPTFSPNAYNQDECYQDGDAGLILPAPYTIIGPIGAETIVPCDTTAQEPIPWIACRMTVWGVNIDIHVENQLLMDAYFNLLIDWDQSGFWTGSIFCPDGNIALEHAVENFVVPAGFSGPLSLLNPPGFRIGPNDGHVWARFTLSEVPVPVNWDGSGDFSYGETEDYLIAIEYADIQSDLDIENVVIPPGADDCFEAENDLTISNSVIESGANVVFTAGNSIRILPSTHVEYGAEALFVIDQNDNFCSNYRSLIAADDENNMVDEYTWIDNADKFFRIYPNPTNSVFTLEILEPAESDILSVEIYNLLGSIILQKEVPSGNQYQFNLSGHKPGIYLVKVIRGNDMNIEKLILQ